MTQLNRYVSLIGPKRMEALLALARPLAGLRVSMISSTRHGGGVAELLHGFTPLLHDVGIQCVWHVMQGNPAFFDVTKKIHNLLQGGRGTLSQRERAIFLDTTYSSYNRLRDLNRADVVIVHDPQPLAFIERRASNNQPWIWRCHVDASAPNPSVRKFLTSFINRYDRVIVSDRTYGIGLKRPAAVIHPAIDPFSHKNAPLRPAVMAKLLREQGIDPAMPFIAQVSRYDRWKDPEGVIRVFKHVRKRVACQLLLLGNSASDDPEGAAVYRRLRARYGDDPNILLLLNVPNNDRFVNAVQSLARVIVQKSVREGFGLTVTEALFKGTPVVASRVGGIPLQIKDGVNGFLHDPQDEDGFADSIVLLMTDERKRARFGIRAHANVVDRFLMTTLLEKWLQLLRSVTEMK